MTASTAARALPVLPADHRPVRLSERLEHRPGPWPLHDAAASRTLDALAAEALPAHALMQRAGLAVARLAMALAPHARRIHVLAGHGNNGGDGFEAALHLLRAGREVRLHVIGRDSDDGRAQAWPPDAAASRRQAELGGVAIVAGLAPQALGGADLVIDALLGRGLARPASGPVADAIRLCNGSGVPVLAVDLPSGLPGDTGALEVGAACVQARWTLALLSLAPGLLTAHGRDQAGEIWWDELGVQLAHPDFPAPAARLQGAAGLQSLWPARRHAQHKGSFGDVRILGGAGSMGGAALLAGRAALGAGAGRVWVDLLDEGAPRLDPVHPELMFAPTPADERLASSTVVAGCGGGEAVAARLAPLLAQAGRLLLDADALNALAADARLMQALHRRGAEGGPTLLTPHPLEAARLLGCSAAEVQADRLRAVRELAARSGAAVVLKGSGTLIGRPGPHHAPWINASGNAALATPGSGDVLAGWIAGLWGQIACGRATGAEAALDEAELAARRGVWLHGRRAERLAAGGSALVASRIVPDGQDG
ncbi:NAD(P)H-hydrate dehydratase [Sphaerotilus uruguayifluvii]|uniref:Bifunctional NAD(P)H-hydrate repair enzyme n=1 Tax=Sphaerotilus uruguayifluvii TaxID=2735897 RepID=A0ABX2G497_9BURK|nr:NAD(P)H-hydrate dehydratase [Leptothrix sp. C29]NRT57150.1 hydroxyethylthiazole kinase-like uncharacterized protein yjeF [Leptothrix sp. C29]